MGVSESSAGRSCADAARTGVLARLPWRLGVSSLLVGAVVVGGLSAPAMAAEAVTEQSVDGASSSESEVGDDWTEPDPSVDASPVAITKDVGRHEEVRVVSVVDVGGRPEVIVQEAEGATDARRQVADAQDTPGVIAVEIDKKVTTQTVNDPRYGELWAMPVLQAEKAWRVSTGAGVVVAVLDTGVDASHPDLQGALVAGKNAIGGDGSAPTWDGNGHGTHVAGTIAARANNGKGIAGLAPGSKVMPVKVLDANGAGWASDVAAGIRWAVDHGADVLNLSLSGPASSTMQPAIEYAVSKRVTVVAAAGNSGANSSGYPGAYPGVISVSALARPGSSLASFSNRGSGVDIAAPGQSILSTVPGGYSSYSGTSMAAPHVAAAAALVLAKNPTANLHSLLAKTATDLGAAGYDSTFAYGRLNLLSALGVPVAVVRRKQTVRYPRRVKVRRNRALAKRTRQGVRIKRWRSKRKRVCRVVKRGSRWKIRGLRRGKCLVVVTAPGTKKFRRKRQTVRIRVR